MGVRRATVERSSPHWTTQSQTVASSFGVTRRQASLGSSKCGPPSAEWRASIADESGGDGTGPTSRRRWSRYDDRRPAPYLPVIWCLPVTLLTLLRHGGTRQRLCLGGDHPRRRPKADPDPFFVSIGEFGLHDSEYVIAVARVTKPSRPRGIPPPRRKSTESSRLPPPPRRIVGVYESHSTWSNSAAPSSVVISSGLHNANMPGPRDRPPNSGSSTCRRTASAISISHSFAW